MPIDRVSLGKKLKRCRENLNLDIPEVSEKIGLSEDRLKKIEFGEIEPTGDEVLILSDYYKQDYRYFVSNEKLSASEQIEIFYRKFGNEFSKEDRFAIQEFIFLCECEEYVLKNQNITKIDFTIPASKGVYKNQGIDAAIKLRRYLGYTGKQLYSDIFSEFRKIGLHVFRRKLSNSNISGLYIKHPIAGKCILVNFSDDIYRQNFTIAHEVGHAILDDKSEFNLSYKKESNFIEIRANAFAGSFLVPKEVFDRIIVTQWTENQIKEISNKLKVNVQTLLIALKNYEKISQAEYNRYINLKVPFTEKEDYELKNLTDKRRKEKKRVIERGLSDFYVKKCHEAYNNKEISAGKLAEMLLVSEFELPELLNIYSLKLNYGY